MTLHKASSQGQEKISHLAEQVATNAVQDFLNTFPSETLDSLPKNFVEEAKASLYHQIHQSVHSSFRWTHQDFCLEKTKQEKIEVERQNQKVEVEQPSTVQASAQRRRRRRTSDNPSQQDFDAWLAQVREEAKANIDPETGKRKRQRRKRKVETATTTQ